MRTSCHVHAEIKVKKEICFWIKKNRPCSKSRARTDKRGDRPSGISGRLRAAALWFERRFPLFFRAYACLRRAQRAALVYDKHTPKCHNKKTSCLSIARFFLFRYNDLKLLAGDEFDFYMVALFHCYQSVKFVMYDLKKLIAELLQ